MVPITLHIEDWHPAVLGNPANVIVADAPITLANRDSITIAPDDLTDFFAGITVLDLRRLGIDKLGMAAKLRPGRRCRPDR